MSRLRDAAARARTTGLGLDRFSGLYLLGFFILLFGLWQPRLFLTTSTLHTVASSQAIACIMCLAVLIPLACGGFDLSVGSVANFSGILAIVMQTQYHWNIGASMGIAILASILIGVTNGLLVVNLRINSFIATLGMSTVILASQEVVTNNGQPPPPTSALWSDLTQHLFGGFQAVILYLLIIAVVVWWGLEHTPAGRYLYAIGGNAEAAKLAGVRVNYWTFLAFVASALIAGIGGLLYASLFGPSIAFGGTLLLPAFAGAFLGATQVKPGRFNVWGAVIAIYTLATGVKGLSLATGALWVNDMFNGVALIVAVGFATWRQRAMLKRPRRASPVKVSTEVPEFPAAGGLPERESVRESDSGDPSRQTAQEY